jgi:hypothetical protein
MGNEVKLTFAGDADKLEKAAGGAGDAASRMADSAQASSDRLGKAWAGINTSSETLADSIGGLGDGMRAITELKNDAAVRADALARAQNDVEQATVDVQQAMQDSAQSLLDWQQACRDTAQSAIDVEQAQLDLEAAQKDYNAAVKEFGPKSLEARQALIDQKQANEDLAQANLDAQQAEEDKKQAMLDGKQATVDATGAQLDLNQAQRDAVPPNDLQVWAERISAIAPVAMTAMGALQLLTTTSMASSVASGIASAATGVWTGVQWLLNAAFWANPVTWVVAGIIALIAVIVLIATKTTWFSDLWDWLWAGIKYGAQAIGDWFSGPFLNFFKNGFKLIGDKATEFWNWLSGIPGKLGSMFSGLADIISSPFKAGFNFISDAWNGSVGKLSWTVPNWVPIIGGNTISAPKLPRFHDGIDRVPGLPGSEMLAILEAGERVVPASQNSSGGYGNTYNINVTVPLEDLAQLHSLEEFLEMLQNNRRRELVDA